MTLITRILFYVFHEEVVKFKVNDAHGVSTARVVRSCYTEMTVSADMRCRFSRLDGA
jgi:hypothetical protein